MARKLKTYITNLGFFELALAAPSMKAALEAWGIGHTAFQNGFARQTEDPKIVAATMAKPGVVLRRPVGTKGAFAENAELPRQLWKTESPKLHPAKPRKKTQPRPDATVKLADRKKGKAEHAAIVSFEKAKALREREREKEASRQAAREKNERAQRKRAAEKAEAALARAQERHDDALAAIEKERAKLDRRAEIENANWETQRAQLKAAIRGARVWR
jgi:hypothetical protein